MSPSHSRSRTHHSVLRAAALAAPALTGSCAGPAKPVFDAADAAHVWPPPPDEPRIRYVGQLQSDADLKPGKRPGQGLGELLFGHEPSHAMLSPLAACGDGQDRVYVADSNAQAVHVFDLRSRKYQLWKPEREGRLTLPVAIAYDAGPGRILVSDSVGGQVATFDRSGKPGPAIGYGLLKRPCGVAVAPDGRIAVADTAGHQIVFFSPEGRELSRLGERGSGPGQFNYPTNLAFDSAGGLCVSDTLNFRVQVFGPDLAFTRQIGKKGDMPGYFSQPKGVALDAAGRIYVVDANFEAVQIFDPTGVLLMTFGREGHGPGEFWLPAGIAIEPGGRIWIADSYNRRIQAFEQISEGTRP